MGIDIFVCGLSVQGILGYIRCCNGVLLEKQECIPVRCVPSAAAAVSRGVSVYGGCLPGWCVCLGGGLPRVVYTSPVPCEQNHRQV